MREEIQNKPNVLYCNCCGQPIKQIEKIGIYTDYLHVEKTWSYFSNKDLSKHSFNLCEACYDKWIETFVIPAQEVAVTEVFKYLEEEAVVDDNEDKE